MALKLVLLLSYVSLLYARSTMNTSVADQTCDGTTKANSKFYCPYDRKCKARSLRCIGANVCNNPATNKEESCHETSTPGKYQVRLGHAKLSDSSSPKKRLFDDLGLEHQFIEYRGFTYEFGWPYGVQILDTADPKYIYKNGKSLNSKGIEYVGSSYCTWQDATKYANDWHKEDYNLVFNNCQHFADGLKKYLTTRVCNRPLSSYVKREDRDAELDEQINQILSDCSIVCCNGTDSGNSNDQPCKYRSWCWSSNRSIATNVCWSSNIILCCCCCKEYS